MFTGVKQKWPFERVAQQVEPVEFSGAFDFGESYTRQTRYKDRKGYCDKTSIAIDLARVSLKLKD